MDIQIPLNSPVQINYPKGELAGVVRYCHYREIGYFVGVQFEAGSRWSQRQFKPLHLLDPRTLVRRAVARDASKGPSIQ